MELVALVEVIATILALAGVGVLLRVTGVLEPDDAHPLNQIIIYVALPALVFRAVHGAELGADLALMALVAWVALLAGFALAWIAARALRLEAKTAAGFLIAAALGNTGYLGYPLALTIFGEGALVRAIFYDIFGTVFGVLTLGLLIANRMGDGGDRRVNLLKEIATFPGVVALLLALALYQVPIPDPVSTGLDALANLVVPLIMISLGVSLCPRTIRERIVAIGTLAGIKLIAVPIVALGAASAVGLDAEGLRLAVMQAGMPSMMLSLVFGIRYRLDVDFIAAAILVTTVGAIVTVPLAQVLLG